MGDVWGEEARVGGGTGDDNRTLDPPRTPPSASPTYAGAQLGSEIVVDEIIGNGCLIFNWSERDQMQHQHVGAPLPALGVEPAPATGPAAWPLWVWIAGSVGSGGVIGLCILITIVVSAKLHKRRRQAQYKKSNLKKELERELQRSALEDRMDYEGGDTDGTSGPRRFESVGDDIIEPVPFGARHPKAKSFRPGPSMAFGGVGNGMGEDNAMRHAEGRRTLIRPPVRELGGSPTGVTQASSPERNKQKAKGAGSALRHLYARATGKPKGVPGGLLAQQTMPDPGWAQLRTDDGGGAGVGTGGGDVHGGHHHLLAPLGSSDSDEMQHVRTDDGGKGNEGVGGDGGGVAENGFEQATTGNPMFGADTNPMFGASASDSKAAARSGIQPELRAGHGGESRFQSQAAGPGGGVADAHHAPGAPANGGSSRPGGNAYGLPLQEKPPPPQAGVMAVLTHRMQVLAQAEDARDRRGQDVNLDHNTHSSQVTALGDSVLSVPAIHTKSVQPIGSHMFSPSTSRTPSPPRARADLRGSSSPTSSPQRMNSLRQQHSCITTSVQGVPSSENLVGMDDFVPPQASHRQYPQATDELMDVEDF